MHHSLVPFSFDGPFFAIVSSSIPTVVGDALTKNNIVISITYLVLRAVDENGNIEMRYHQINDKGELMTGACFSKPEILANGKTRLHETWEWTSGDRSIGKSILEEI